MTLCIFTAHKIPAAVVSVASMFSRAAAVILQVYFYQKVHWSLSCSLVLVSLGFSPSLELKQPSMQLSVIQQNRCSSYRTKRSPSQRSVDPSGGGKWEHRGDLCFICAGEGGRRGEGRGLALCEPYWQTGVNQWSRTWMKINKQTNKSWKHHHWLIFFLALFWFKC